MVGEPGGILDGEDRAERMTDQDNRLPHPEPVKRCPERREMIVDGVREVGFGSSERDPGGPAARSDTASGERRACPRSSDPDAPRAWRKRTGGPVPSSRVASTGPAI